MKKRNRKLVSILLTLALLAALLVPMATPAAAACTYTMSNVAVVTAGGDVGASMGTLRIQGDSTFAKTGKYVYLTLPADPVGYSFTMTATTPTNVNGNANALVSANGDVYLEKLSARQYKITIKSVTTSGNDAAIDLTFNNLNIPSGVTGEVVLTADAPSSSTFTGNASIVIAKVNAGAVIVAAESAPSFGSSGGNSGTIRVKETNFGGLTGDPMLKFKLPSGFSWRSGINALPNFTVYWGLESVNSGANQAITAGTFTPSVSSDGRTLSISLTNATNNVHVLKSGTFWSFNWPIDVDESLAKSGDVAVSISGDSSASPATLVVAKYGEYGSKISAVDAPDLVAGKTDQKLGKFKIEELLANSLVTGRTVTLTLPAQVAWVSGPSVDSAASETQGVSGLNNWTPVGTDGRTIKAELTVTNESDAASIVLKDAEVIPASGFNGDLKVTVGGSEGLTGELLLAKVKPMISAAAAAKTDVKIGIPGQSAADITITEAAAGNIASTITYSYVDSDDDLAHYTTASGNAEIILEAPRGVTFTTTPKVEVTSGDLALDLSGVDTDTTDDGKGQIIIPVKSTSMTASTIKISGVQLTVDRTVPEGPLSFDIKGTAVDETTFDPNNTDNTRSKLFTAHTAATVAVANVVTPAPVDQKNKVVFKLNDTKFTLNGAEVTMEVAPYVKDGRTYLPLRYVAQALGVTDNNILWDGAAKKVTLLKGEKVVQLTIGSSIMLVNGMPITMDVAPEITNDRTCLPIRFVAQVLGATVGWDEATQTVTIN